MHTNRDILFMHVFVRTIYSFSWHIFKSLTFTFYKNRLYVQNTNKVSVISIDSPDLDVFLPVNATNYTLKNVKKQTLDTRTNRNYLKLSPRRTRALERKSFAASKSIKQNVNLYGTKTEDF